MIITSNSVYGSKDRSIAVTAVSNNFSGFTLSTYPTFKSYKISSNKVTGSVIEKGEDVVDEDEVNEAPISIINSY
jgi:hypothetical protein